ncbi:hypothetical protein MTO96_015946 [Rhipicephalus appendiculatus]
MVPSPLFHCPVGPSVMTLRATFVGTVVAISKVSRSGTVVYVQEKVFFRRVASSHLSHFSSFEQQGKLTSSGEVAEAVFPCGGGGGLRPPSEIPSVSAAVRSACSPMEKDAGAAPASAYRTGYNVMSSRSSDGTNVCSIILTFISLLVISVTFPFSLFFCIKWPVLAALLRPELASTPSFPAINLLRPELATSRRRRRVPKAWNALRRSGRGARSRSNPYERRIKLASRQSLGVRST